MRIISSRPIFTLAFFASSNLRRSHFVAFSTHSHQSSYPRRYEEESRAVRVSVWWDFENCNIPVNTNAFRVAQCVTNAVRANGIKGPIQITAFGDVMQISRTNQEALSSTGINLTHVPSGGKNSADRSLLVDLMYWVSQNPPPAHVFLISGDRDFAGILHRLRMNNYNILLASPDSAPNVLCSAATVMWQWSVLLKGENLSGKLFNQPPDGPFHSWYGHIKAPLEDPFAVAGQSSGPVTNKLCDVAPVFKVEPVPKTVVTEKSSSDESCSAAPNPRGRPIPKAVVKYISHFLQSHPEGIAITHLREALSNSNLALEKELYGYKKFSRFLLAMPHILELQSGNDGVILVRSVNTKNHDKSVSNGEAESCSVSKLRDEKGVKAESTNLQEVRKEDKQNESSLSMKMQDKKVQVGDLQNLKKEENRKGSSTKTTTHTGKPEKVDLGRPVVEMKDSSEKNEKQVVVLDGSSSASVGFFRRIWMILFGSRDNEVSSFPALFSPSSHEAILDKRNTRSGDAVSDISDQDSGFFSSKIMGWFKLSSSSGSNNKAEKDGEKSDQSKVNPKQVELFAKESFWKEMESFINSSLVSTSISKSMTRLNLAQNLQKHGPPVLKSLSESDLLHLVDLLISDKKWVAECNSQIFPFRINRPSRSNGLSHIFSANQESGERKHQNPPHAGLPQSSSKARKVVLADCKKLVDQIVEEHPEGFNTGGFRKLFLEKHGYALDLQKLGYDKLVSLLQIMPGVRIESNLILPADSVKNLDLQNKVGPVSDSQIDEGGAWDELGPIENEMDTKFSRKHQNGRTEPDYEPLQEDDLSGSDDETSRAENENKARKEEEEASLLDILDSWYVDKGGNVKKNDTTGTASVTDSEEVGSPASTHSTKNGSAALKPPRKAKPGKSYSFVSEHPADNKDKLVEGILGSLKKSGEKSADSQVLS